MISTIFESIALNLTSTYRDLTLPNIRNAYNDLLPQVFSDLGLNLPTNILEQYLSSDSKDMFEAPCPLGYIDLGNSTCQSLKSIFSDEVNISSVEATKFDCNRLDFSAVGVVSRLALMHACSLDGWSQKAVEYHYQCPKDWSNSNGRCVPNNATKSRCDYMPLVDELNREVNARRCLSDLWTTNSTSTTEFAPVAQSLNSGQENDKIYTSIADSFLQQTASFSFEDFARFLEIGHFDDWLREANIKLSPNLEVCANGFVESENRRLCLQQNSLNSTRCPPQYKKFTTLTHKLIVYALCQYSDRADGPAQHGAPVREKKSVASTPTDYSNLTNLKQLTTSSGPIQNSDGDILNLKWITLKHNDIIRYDDAFVEPSLSFLAVSTNSQSLDRSNAILQNAKVQTLGTHPISEMGVLRNWLLTLDKVLPRSIVQNSLRKTEADLVIFEEANFAHEFERRPVCRAASATCPLNTQMENTSSCVLSDPRDRFEVGCPYRGHIPATPDLETRRILEEICGVEYACQQCNMDFNNFECPEGWIYLSDAHICQLDQSEVVEKPQQINVYGWTANDRAEYAANNHLAWPCLDTTGCKRDYTSPCPEHFASLSIISPVYEDFCIAGSDQSYGLCPSILRQDHPAVQALAETYKKVVGKELRTESVIIWNASRDTRSRINLSSVCGVRWPCHKSCKIDYKLPCAVGWSVEGSMCKPSRHPQSNFCDLEVYSENLSLRDKRVLATVCGLQWPCKPQCQQDYSKSCPVKWSATKKKNIVTCTLRSPVLHSTMAEFEVTHSSHEDKKQLAQKHGLRWPCVKP